MRLEHRQLDVGIFEALNEELIIKVVISELFDTLDKVSLLGSIFSLLRDVRVIRQILFWELFKRRRVNYLVSYTILDGLLELLLHRVNKTVVCWYNNRLLATATFLAFLANS